MFGKLSLAMACLVMMMSCVSARQQGVEQVSSTGRGARDPQQVDVIVGSEGKGMFTGAGIPPDNMPIYAAKDGATPPAASDHVKIAIRPGSHADAVWSAFADLAK